MARVDAQREPHRERTQARAWRSARAARGSMRGNATPALARTIAQAPAAGRARMNTELPSATVVEHAAAPVCAFARRAPSAPPAKNRMEAKASMEVRYWRVPRWEESVHPAPLGFVHSSLCASPPDTRTLTPHIPLPLTDNTTWSDSPEASRCGSKPAGDGPGRFCSWAWPCPA
jgi:hypothetical protein